MSDLLQRLQAELSERATPALLRKPAVDLFLGNDREIGRELRSQEKRVGITPTHVKRLKDFLSAVGVGLNVFVLSGAGQRAGFPDSDFIRRGDEVLAEILTESELEDHDRAPDVFHALKEPSKYESRLPGPFCRIGAVHSGNFHAESGLAKLLAGGDVAIFDGSNTGGPEAGRIPIRGRMSTFAGEIAAEWIGAHLRAWNLRGHVVIVGGGYAGQAAARELAKEDEVTRIHLFENKARPERAARTRDALAGLADKVEVLESLSRDDNQGRDDPALLEKLGADCAAVLFAVAQPGKKAPKVVHVSHLASLAGRAIVVDISIDERGAIFDPSIPPDWEASRIIKHLEGSLNGTGRVYRAQENMPRSRAGEASEAHGDVILPYLATLLYLAAREGGGEGVRRFMAERAPDLKCGDPQAAPAGRLLDALTQDLRNGMAFHTSSGRIVIEDIVPDRVNLISFLMGKGDPSAREMPFEFSLRSRETLDEEQRLETESALALFPKDVREFLEFAFEKGVTGSVISHPKMDGTTTAGAAKALSVPPANVLKTLIWKKGEAEGGELIATISSGVKFIDTRRLREETGASTIRKAEPNEVMTATRHVPGAVPTIGLFKFKDDGIIKEIYVSEEVLALDSVYGSAGSVFLGLKFKPQELERLGACVRPLTRPDSLLRKSQKEVEQILSGIKRAIERDDDKAALKCVRRMEVILRGGGAGGGGL